MKEKEYKKLNSEIKKVTKKLADEKKKQAKRKESIEDRLKDLDELIEKVVNDTNQLGIETIRYGAKRGFAIICEFINFDIGGRKVPIDPLRVGI